MAKTSLNYILQALKIFIEEKVASKITLLKERSVPEEYVNPFVGIITLPHKNFMPVNFQVPHILIGLEKGTNNMDKNHTINIRIQCATYGGEYQFEEDANIPDEKGYLDLLNLLERVMHELLQATVIGNCTIDTEFDYGIYDDEMTYPYWYGYIRFSIEIPIINRQIEDFI